MASVLSNNMNDIKNVTFFMGECKRMKLEVLGPDLNESYYKFSVNKDKKGTARILLHVPSSVALMIGKKLHARANLN